MESVKTSCNTQTIEKWTKSNRNWLTSGDIILIFNLQDFMLVGIKAGKFGDTIYVTLLRISWLHVAVTVKWTKYHFFFCSFILINTNKTYTRSMHRNQEHIDPSMYRLVDDNRKHSYKSRFVDHPVSCTRLQQVPERSSILKRMHKNTSTFRPLLLSIQLSENKFIFELKISYCIW